MDQSELNYIPMYGLESCVQTYISLSFLPCLLTALFNLTGVFPYSWKCARVVPIPKSGDLSNPANYRPISVLPILSKVLEKHIHNVIGNLTNHWNPKNYKRDQEGRAESYTRLLPKPQTTYNYCDLTNTQEHLIYRSLSLWVKCI